ncbi:M15 family metallopeptidase [Solibaculum mannosilyticum]
MKNIRKKIAGLTAAVVAVVGVAAFSAWACFVQPEEMPAQAVPAYQIITEKDTSSKGDTTIVINQKDIYRGNLLLVNPWNAIPEELEDISLRNLYEQYPDRNYQLAGTNMMLQEEAARQANLMFDAAKEAGQENYLLRACYRTQDDQEEILEDELEKYQSLPEDQAENKALSKVAKPGTSEHQLGLAMDVNVYVPGQWSKAFGDTAQCGWLTGHSWQYGWVVRYDEDKSDITGITNEPWHFRYVGVPHAAIMVQKDLCLEEYLELLRQQKHIKVTDEQGETYHIRYVQLGSQPSMTLRIPSSQYAISGDNLGGVIVTWKDETSPQVSQS